MVKILKDNFNIIVLIFLVFMFIKGCADSRKMSTILTVEEQIKTEIESIKDSTYTKTELDIRLTIVGLESEKRMIQATDRKMLDVQRQNNIEEEIRYWKAELDKLSKTPKND